MPEFGVFHVFLELLDIVEGLFSQFFRRLDDQSFGCVGRRFHLAHFGRTCTNRPQREIQRWGRGFFLSEGVGKDVNVGLTLCSS